MAGALFYQRMIEFTEATCDGEHLNIWLDGTVTTPDRTAFFQKGKNASSPLPSLLFRARRLVDLGAEMLAIPCNTAHCFYPALSTALPVPLFHIAQSAISELLQRKVQTVGVLCTAGTRQERLYTRLCEQAGILCRYPNEGEQAQLDSLIYHKLKAGTPPSPTFLHPFLFPLLERGCDTVLLACTELSLCYTPTMPCLDTLSILAGHCVLGCGGRLSQVAKEHHL